MIATWAERCEKFGDEIVTNAKIQQVMQEEIDELRSKMDKMLDDIVNLTDNLFSERRECLKLEKELALQKLSDIGQAIEQEPTRSNKPNNNSSESFYVTSNDSVFFTTTGNESFDRTASHMADEYVGWLEKTDEQVIANAEKRFPFLKKASEK